MKNKIISKYLNDKKYNFYYKLYEVIFMAKPIAKTPPLEGEDAIAVLKKMQEPPTEEDKEFAREIRNQRIVLF